MGRRLKKVLAAIAYIICVFSAVLVFLKAADLFLGLEPANPVSGLQRPGPTDPRTPDLPLTSYQVYPFTGVHTLPDACVHGGALCSGDHGFRVSFDLDAPPPKPPATGRIILVGGSAAWGFGAYYPAEMIDQVLERSLNEAVPCGRFTRFEVVNLAMNGSVSQQNAIALNLWGHALAPDMIVSFSGYNDLLLEHRQSYAGFPYVWANTNKFHFGKGSEWHRRLGAVFPNIIKHTKIGLALRILELGSVDDYFDSTFASRFPPTFSEQETLRKVKIPAYVHALKTIKRDFEGIPIMVAYQPYLLRPGRGTEHGGPRDELITTRLAEYEIFRNQAMARLRSYQNGDWIFFDTHQFMDETYLKSADPAKVSPDGVHLTAREQGMVAKEMSRRITGFFCGR